MATQSKQRPVIDHFQISTALVAGSTVILVPPRSRELSTGDTGAESLANAAGTATAGAATTLTDGGKTWTVNVYDGSIARITSGTGAGQANYIVSNTATVLTMASTWRITPDATSVYRIEVPCNTFFVLRSIYLSHATTAGTVTLNSRAFYQLGGAASTEQEWAYNSGAGVANNVPWRGCLRGLTRGSIELVTVTAVGSITVEGYYLNDPSIGVGPTTSTGVLQTFVE